VFIEEFKLPVAGAAGKFKTSAIANSDSLGKNVAVDGTAFGSGSLQGYCSDTGPSNGQAGGTTGTHCIKNINDGKTGDSNSWIPSATAYKGQYFVGVKLKSPITLKGFVIARDGGDRRNGNKQVQVTAAANPGIATTEWIDLGASFKLDGGKSKYSFSAEKDISVTGIRVVTTDKTDAIGEIEIYGDLIHDSKPSPADALDYIVEQMDVVTKAADSLKTAGSMKGLGSMQVFTSAGAGTWKRPQGCTRIRVFCTGAGAGGGSHNTDDAQGGGGAGGTSIKMLDVKSTSSFSFRIGTGGNAGTGNSASGGGNGGATTCGGSIRGNGGIHVPTWAIGGEGGTASGGDVNQKGGYGHNGNIDGWRNSEAGGGGGDSYWGGGGRGSTNWGSNTAGRYGGGGGGNHANRGDSSSRGKGGNGIMVVEEYY
jgi:hypothetical protein